MLSEMPFGLADVLSNDDSVLPLNSEEIDELCELLNFVPELTYRILSSAGKLAINCTKCGLTSYNANDVIMRYCANCDLMHEYGRPRRLEDIHQHRLITGQEGV